MTRHEWRDRTEDGELLYHRASQHAGSWRFQSKLKKETQWTYYDPDEFPMESLKSFREVLFNKHLRRRVHMDHLEHIDAIIEKREKAEAAAAEEESVDSE